MLRIQSSLNLNLESEVALRCEVDAGDECGYGSMIQGSVCNLWVACWSFVLFYSHALLSLCDFMILWFILVCLYACTHACMFVCMYAQLVQSF
jgi:hypothetical protein